MSSAKSCEESMGENRTSAMWAGDEEGGGGRGRWRSGGGQMAALPLRRIQADGGTDGGGRRVRARQAGGARRSWDR